MGTEGQESGLTTIPHWGTATARRGEGVLGLDGKTRSGKGERKRNGEVTAWKNLTAVPTLKVLFHDGWLWGLSRRNTERWEKLPDIINYRLSG